MKLRLICNHDAFSIITETAGQYKIKILDLRLIVRKIKPSQDVLAHHQRFWKNQDAVFQFHQTKIMQHLIPTGVASTQISLTSGVLPKQVRKYIFCKVSIYVIHLFDFFTDFHSYD